MNKTLFLDFSLPEYKEIPNVGLYLKQVVSFINEATEPILHTTVTTTMLSNYVKMHMLPNSVKKMYSRNHIARFLFIVMAKNVLSLENIGKLLEMSDSEDFFGEYRYFSQEFVSVLKGTSSESADSEITINPLEKELIDKVIITLVKKIQMDEAFLSIPEKNG